MCHLASKENPCTSVRSALLLSRVLPPWPSAPAVGPAPPPSNTGANGAEQGDVLRGPETPSGTAAPVRDANVDLVIWTDADRSKAVQKYADQFAAESVSVKVQISTDTRRAVQGRHEGRQGPGRHRRCPRLARRARPELDGRPGQPLVRRRGEVPPKAIEATKFNGQSYGVPYAVENIGLMYNKDLVPNRAEDHGRARRHRREARQGGQGQAGPVAVRLQGRQRLLRLPVPLGLRTAASSPEANGGYDPDKADRQQRGLRQGRRGPARTSARRRSSRPTSTTRTRTLFDTKVPLRS